MKDNASNILDTHGGNCMKTLALAGKGLRFLWELLFLIYIFILYYHFGWHPPILSTGVRFEMKL